MTRPCLLLTGRRATNERLTAHLRDRGIDSRSRPRIEIVHRPERLDEPLTHIAEYDWLILTSRVAARRVVVGMDRLGMAVPEGVRIACVGGSTAAVLREAGCSVSLVGEGTGGELVESPSFDGGGGRILFPVGNLAGDGPRNRLREKGYRVDDPVCYETRRVTGDGDVLRKELAEVDGAVFLSPSGVEAFRETVGSEAGGLSLPAFAIGPTTADALSWWPGAVRAPGRPGLKALVGCIRAYF